MKLIDKFKIFKKSSTIRKKLDKLISELPNNDIMARELLNELDNTRTKCIFDKDINGSYYVYLNDTMYLCDKQSKQTNYERLCVIAHESIHSVQPKFLQNINFILSNLEIVSFFIFLVLCFFKINKSIIYLGYLVVALLSMVPRLILELWALIKAPKLSKKYLETHNIAREDIEKVYNSYMFSTKVLMPIAIIGFFTYKFIRIIIASILTFTL